MTTVGIDVGAKELVVAIRQKASFKKIKTFENNAKGHKKILTECSSYLKQGKVRIAMEATGAYYLDLAIKLTSDACLEIMVINPHATKSFARAIMERNKTDKIDAQVLALFAEKMEYPLWEKPSKEAIQLRYFARTIHSLTTDKTKTKNYLHALQSCAECPNELIKMLTKHIFLLEQEINILKQAALSIIEQNVDLKVKFDLIQTIKGFAEASSILVLTELIIIPRGLTNRQWVAYAGLDPKQFQSGTSVNKKSRISKAGNRYLRKSLFMPALSASKCDEYIKAYFTHLIEKRKLAKLQAIVAVMRKLIHALHGILHSLRPFDNTKFFKNEIAVES